MFIVSAYLLEYGICHLLWLKCVNNGIENVDRGPGQEEKNTDTDQHDVRLLSPLHLPGLCAGGDGYSQLRAQEAAHSGGERQNNVYILLTLIRICGYI